MYNFDEKVIRKNTSSDKWDNINEFQPREDVIPLWVADMDFKVSPNIVKGIEKRVSHEVFGYTYLTDSYYEAIINWMKNVHNWKVQKEWIRFCPGVMSGINCMVNCFTEPEDEIIVQSPVYHQFFKVIEQNNRKTVYNELIFDNGRYTMDFKDLENKITSKTKMLILCNPHNPVGRVWSTEELRTLGEICLKNNIIVVSDEVHSDIIYKDYKHNVFSTVDERFKDISIICTSPGKTFNISGFQISNLIIENEDIRKKLSVYLEKFHIGEPNVFTAIVQETAYNQGEIWYREVLDYLEENKNYFIDFIEKRIPKIKIVKPEGTYLLWMDCSELNMDSKELDEFFIKKCGLILNAGRRFKGAADKFQRVNIATQRHILKEALERMEQQVKSL